MGASLAVGGADPDSRSRPSTRPRRTPTAGAFAAVVALGLFCTAVAFVIFTVLIREAGTSRATVITYVNPVIAAGARRDAARASARGPARWPVCC